MLRYSFQENAHLQGALHHAKSWKTSADKHEKEVKREKAERTKLEGCLKTKEDELAEVHTDLVKDKDKREKLINFYMTSPKFKDLMTQHDVAIFPAHFSISWDSALKVVQKKFSQLNPSDFPRPVDPVILKQLMAEQKSETEDGSEEESDEEDKEEEVGQGQRILDPNSTPLKAPVQDPSSSSSEESSEGEDEEEGEPFKKKNDMDVDQSSRDEQFILALLGFIF